MGRIGMRNASAVVGFTTVTTLVLIVLGCLIFLVPTNATTVNEGSMQRISAAATASVANDALRGRDKKGKLPFHTGSIVQLISPWLDYACDTASDSSPYGPYNPDGGDGGWWPRRRLSDEAMGRKGGKGLSYPYGPDDDPAQAIVWCNATISHKPPRPYTSGSDSDSDSGLRINPGQANGDTAVEGSQWDLDGFMLMGTDFTSPDVFSGSRVFLKNQASRKFCRLADSGVEKYDDLKFRSELYAALVCDQMTSSEETEFVLELEEEELEEEALRDVGGDDWPGPGGGGDTTTSVKIRLRAPRNDMRYCAPNRKVHGSPIVCDLRHPDASHRHLTTFELADAAPSQPY